MIDEQLLASIIQGEAGGMGHPGMWAVAFVMTHRIYQDGHTQEDIEREWTGRAEPAKDGIALDYARRVNDHSLADGPYHFCMGETIDVIPHNWVDGDAVVRVGNQALHLYKEWPREKEG